MGYQKGHYVLPMAVKKYLVRKRVKKTNMHTVLVIGLIIFLTLLSGWGDSQGFLHASNVWNHGKLQIGEILISAISFGLGTIMYWIVIRYLDEFGIISPEVQTLGWFSITIIGIALVSKAFFRWSLVDQIIGLIVIAGIAWLMFRTSG